VARVDQFLARAEERDEPPFALVIPLASVDPRLRAGAKELLPPAVTQTLFAK
jgi:hypothetical protein